MSAADKNKSDGGVGGKFTAEEMLEKDEEFAAFVTRMRLTQRAFPVKDTTGSGELKMVTSDFCLSDREVVELVQEDIKADEVAKRKNSRPNEGPDAKVSADEVPLVSESDPRVVDALRVNKDRRAAWLALSLREFLQRQERFRRTFGSRSKISGVVVLFALLVVGLLYMFWPLWDVLIDVEANDHYNTLGLSSSATSGDVKKAYRALVKQWHPDHNPDCGDRCREMMMRVQEAYDVLLEKGDSSRRYALKQQYQEMLMRLRGLVFYRVYTIGFFSSEFINTLVFSVLTTLPNKVTNNLRLAIRASCVVVLSLLEIVFVSGPDVVIFLQLFYFGVTMVRAGAELSEVQKVSKRSNFDIRRDLFFFVIPAALIHTIHFLFIDQYPQRSQFVYKMVVGLAVLTGHLARFAPNLFDNIAMVKCSMPQDYYNREGTVRNGRMETTLRFSKWNVITTELGFLMDDVFAFSTHVAAPYRVIMYAVHGAYLLQMYLLPWDGPAIGRVESKVRQRQEEEERKRQLVLDENEARANERASAFFTPEDDDDIDDANHDKGSSTASPHRPPPSQLRVLSDEEASFAFMLDMEAVNGLDLVANRHQATINRLEKQFAAQPSTQPSSASAKAGGSENNKATPAGQRGVNPTVKEKAIFIGYAPDLQHICFMTKETVGAEKKIHLTERGRVKDVEGVRILVSEVGIRALVAAPNTPPPQFPAEWRVPFVKQLQAQYRGVAQLEERLAKEDPQMVSAVARSESSSTAMAISAASLLVVLAAAVVGLATTVRTATWSPTVSRYANAQQQQHPMIRPVGNYRYHGYLPEHHRLNAVHGGSVVSHQDVTAAPNQKPSNQKKPQRVLPLLVPDLFDAIRQLPEQQQQQAEQPRQQQESSGSGSQQQEDARHSRGDGAEHGKKKKKRTKRRGSAAS